jgi:hypothetical protein
MSNIRKIILGLAITCIIIIFIIIFRSHEKTPVVISRVPVTNISVFDPENATYTIDGKTYKIVDGISRIELATSSASEIVTRYFGNKATGDLNGDGKDDYAYLITQDPGGSGLFYYVVAALSSATSSTDYTITPAILLGDRIAPQSTLIQSDELLVNYADRKADEPMSTQPSVGKTLYLKVSSDGTLEKVSP